MIIHHLEFSLTFIIHNRGPQAFPKINSSNLLMVKAGGKIGLGHDIVVPSAFAEARLTLIISTDDRKPGRIYSSSRSSEEAFIRIKLHQTSSKVLYNVK